MNKRKLLTLAMSLCVLAIVAIGGTLAYFTDSDEVTNTFTLGNVVVKINEQERVFDEDGKATGLQTYTDGKILKPIVGSAQGEKDQYGMPIAANFLDKIVTVTNTGKSDAYVRAIIATPAKVTTGDKNNSSDSPLHVSQGNRFDKTGAGKYSTGDGWKTDYKWDWANCDETQQDVIIDGVAYDLMVVNYTEVLAPNAETQAVIAGAYLDARVNFEENTEDDDDPNGGKYFWQDNANSPKVYLDDVLNDDNKLPIKVFVQAIQADGFNSAAEAFAAEQTFLPDNPWNANTETNKSIEAGNTTNQIAQNNN